MTKDELVAAFVAHCRMPTDCAERLISLAADGTFIEPIEDFLDHIYELDIETQTKLLRGLCYQNIRLVLKRPIKRWTAQHQRAVAALTKN